MFGIGGPDVSLGEVGVQLDLIHRRDDLKAPEKIVQVVTLEVADADRSDLAVGQQSLERPVGRNRLVEPVGRRLVEDEQVELVDAQFAGRFSNAWRVSS